MTGRRVARLTVVLVIATTAHRRAEAQDFGAIGLNTAGLVSIQPVDSSYVGPGGPYLDRGLGGLGPGFSIGLNLVADHFALVLEYNTAWLSVAQKGRLVNGGQGTGRLRDSMATALAGAQLGNRRTRIQLLGGISYLMGTPSSNGVSRNDPAANLRREALTFGTDIITFEGSRASLLVTGRVYPSLERSESARQLGVGRDVFRAGVGVRWSLGRD